MMDNQPSVAIGLWGMRLTYTNALEPVTQNGVQLSPLVKTRSSCGFLT